MVSGRKNFLLSLVLLRGSQLFQTDFLFRNGFMTVNDEKAFSPSDEPTGI